MHQEISRSLFLQAWGNRVPTGAEAAQSGINPITHNVSKICQRYFLSSTGLSPGGQLYARTVGQPSNRRGIFDSSRSRQLGRTTRAIAVGRQ